MKKQLITMLAICMGLSAYAQKDELKSTEKALKSGDLVAAKTSVDQAEGLIANADSKLKANFYFLKAKTYYDIAKKNPALDANAIDVAAKSFEDLIAFEKETGKAKYTEEATPLLNALADDMSTKGLDEFKADKFAMAKNTLYKRYKLRNEQDTIYLYYAAHAALSEKDYDTALNYFTKLIDLNYTGITTVYSAINIESGEKENFNSKAQMELMVKSKQHKDPKVEVTESDRDGILKNIKYILGERGEYEKVLALIQEDRNIEPKNLDLIMEEANIYLKMDQKDKFTALMKEAILQDPNNAILYFNVGAINQQQGNMEEAKSYYNKAIELDPNYTDAFLNLSAALLEEENKLIEEMNNNLSNFKKYDAIKAKQKALFKEVLPYLEKAYTLKKEQSKEEDIDIVRTLMGLYENLEMNDKFKEMKAIWDASRD